MTTGTLTGWLTHPDPRRGIRFLEPAGGWSFHAYPQLAASAFAVAELLREHGVGPGDPVVLLLGSGPEFVAGFFGALAAGAVPAPIAPPLALQDDAEYRLRMARQVAALGPAVVLTRPAWSRLLEGSAGGRARVLPVTAAELAARADAPRSVSPPTRRALVQFTSGSTGQPRAVAVSAEALAANVSAIGEWLRMAPDDPTASWLPFHHDMGLVGCLLTPVVHGSDLWVMRPEDFVRSPVQWLRCFGEQGARLTAAPCFGLAHVLRRVRPEALAGLDFSRWRAVITGAERIDPRVLERFVALLEPHGFDSRALLPAYGLAEATLAVTGVALREEPSTVTVDRRTLRPGRPVGLRAEEVPEADRLILVGCGRALVAGSTVAVVDAGGRPLPEDYCGEIVVSGPSVANGRLGTGARNGRAAFAGGSVRTGDCGFLHDGQLYVVGRLGDSLKRRGRTVFAEDLEAELSRIAALQRRRPAVLLGTLAGADTAVVVVEGRSGGWIAEVEQLLHRRLDGIAVVVVVGPRGTVRRTTSGKPRRRPMWDAFVAGTLGGTVVAGAAPPARVHEDHQLS
ncbi:AMP-binding protein [Kitasatospora sp. GP82]|uniref:AMP-binding protein n=1 Tax=Kitasatospora sp. GP82 TaxID=3035089 RepID=UPI0024753633|nr:AMP-binding protein [Kitasatospora sp. GP82]MDH6128359.1 acyl-CoA synthetase (AMP-forming)/AMP-acid ligase II [Kitasatospora sp. GP82]